MISKVKGAVKTALMQRKIEEYYAGLDAQFVSYDEWITQKEETVFSGDSSSATETQDEALRMSLCMEVEVIEYASCKADFSEKISSYANENEILLFVNNKEFLAEGARSIIADFFVSHPECVLVYADEDEWNSNRSIRMNPWFKPDFSPDTLLSYFYFGNMFALRTKELQNIVWKKSDDFMMNLYDMCLQMAIPVKRNRIGHLQYVLYHADALKELCTENVYADLKNEYAKRTFVCAKEGEATPLNDKISVVIPSKDHPEVLQVCLESLINTGKSENYEIVVVDNGSNEEARLNYEELKIKYGFNYIYRPMDFNFSVMCNMGAKAATGNVLLFLNDDIEAKEQGFVEKMYAHVKKLHVGAVGAKLYYPDSKMIQHAGITNLRLGPVHKMQFLTDNRSYYYGRNIYDYNVLAVTAACLMIRKEVFDECGGFSEELAVAFNDVELCFRLYETGYYNVQCNEAVLCHHESLSRGNDETTEKQQRLQRERSKMYAMHPGFYGEDPFYHPYLNGQILDTNFSCAYEYPAAEELDVCVPKLLKNGVQAEWYNECLLISMEYAGDLTAWLKAPDKSGDTLYFQGYQFVVGSDNAGFERFILLKNADTEQTYSLPCAKVFRPDLEVNVPEGHVSLCGFACVTEKKNLPPGRYQVGCLASSTVSRQKLCRFVNKYINI